MEEKTSSTRTARSEQCNLGLYYNTIPYITYYRPIEYLYLSFLLIVSGPVNFAGQAKVGNLHYIVIGQKDISGRQVSMEDLNGRAGAQTATKRREKFRLQVRACLYRPLVSTTFQLIQTLDRIF